MKSAFIVAMSALLLAGGAYAVYIPYIEPSASAAASEPAAQGIPQQGAATQAEFNKTFQNVLNTFLKDVQIKAKEYKSRRKVIIELVKPQNLGNPAYVQENQQMMDTLIPELKAKMDEIMAVFNQAETDIRSAISTQPADKQQSILNKWRSVRDEQANTYLAFFSSENDILQVYQEMMQFYKDRQGAYAYDEVTRSLLFTNPADKPHEHALRDRIKELESVQIEAMRKASERPEPEDAAPDVSPEMPALPEP